MVVAWVVHWVVSMVECSAEKWVVWWVLPRVDSKVQRQVHEMDEWRDFLSGYQKVWSMGRKMEMMMAKKMVDEMVWLME